MEQTLPAYRIVNAARGWDWLVEGFELFKRNPGIWIALSLIWGLAVMLGSAIGVGQLILPLFTPVILGGLMIGCAELKRGEELEIGHLFAGFQKKPFVPLLLVGVALLVAQIAVSVVVVVLLWIFGAGSLLSGLLAGQVSEAAGWATGMGGMALGVLIVVLLALLLYSLVWMALAFAPALVALGGEEPLPALQDSLRAAFANWPALLIYSLITIALLIVALIPAGLGLLVLGPVMIGANYAAYRDVYPNLPEQLPQD
ncbi:BPSS1780 family membrane protein [Chitinimonas naiadis]